MNINERLFKNKIAIDIAVQNCFIDSKLRAIRLFKKVRSIQKLCIIFEE
jgi:hypothetical protein